MTRLPAMPSMEQDLLVEWLTADLQPVRPLSDRPALAALAILLAAVAALVVSSLQPRADLAAGTLNPMFLMRAGTLLALGGVATAALLAHARPGVGRSEAGWRAALLLAGLFPLSAALMAMQAPQAALAVITADMASGIECLLVSLAAALALAVPLLAHLRRGAPVAPERAGLLVGQAAGSLGAFAYSLHCPYDNMVYIGLWNGLAVAAATLAGRLLVPPLIRW